MGGVLDFLFGQQAPANTQTGATKSGPQYMSDAGYNVAGKINAAMNDPYTPYQGPRIASPTQDQQAGWQMARDTAGAYQPSINGALTQSQATMGQVDPYYNQAATGIHGGMGKFTGSTVGDYMNPYTQNVIDRGTQLAMRNYNENVAPGLRSEFIGSGQYGSLGHEAEADRAARDLSEGIQSNAMAQYGQAYDAGRGAFENDQSRQIQGGQAMGQLAQSYGQLADQNSSLQGELAGQGQAMGIKGASALDATGQEQNQYTQRSLDQAYQDFQNQNNWQRNMIDWGVNAYAGTPGQGGSTTYTAPSSAGYGPSPLQNAASIYSMYKGYTSARGGVVRKARGGLWTERDYPRNNSKHAEALKNFVEKHRGTPGYINKLRAAFGDDEAQRHMGVYPFGLQPDLHGLDSDDVQGYAAGGLSTLQDVAAGAPYGASGNSGDVPDWLKGLLAAIAGQKGSTVTHTPQQAPDIIMPQGGGGQQQQGGGGGGGLNDLFNMGKDIFGKGGGRNVDMWPSEGSTSSLPTGAFSEAVPNAAEAWSAPTAESLGAPASSFTMAGAVPEAEALTEFTPTVSMATPAAAGAPAASGAGATSSLGATLGGTAAAVAAAVALKHLSDNAAGIDYNQSRQLADFLHQNSLIADPKYGRGKYSTTALSPPPPGFKSWSQYFAATQIVQDSMHASGGKKDQGTYSMLLDEQGLPTDKSFYMKVYPGQELAYRTIIGPNGLGTGSNSKGGRARGGLARLCVE